MNLPVLYPLYSIIQVPLILIWPSKPLILGSNLSFLPMAGLAPALIKSMLGLYPKNPETPMQKNLCTPMFIAVQFTIAKCWKQPRCPSVNEWIKKLWCIYTMEFYEAERKKELLPFVTVWMELESIMLSEISQVVKDKYHMISPLIGT